MRNDLRAAEASSIEFLSQRLDVLSRVGAFIPDTLRHPGMMNAL
jgi:hypothetical protein